MRVLHVIPAVAPRYGGPSVVVLAACHALRAAGHDVLVVATDADGPGRLKLPTGEATDYGGVPVLAFRRIASEAFKWSPALAAWLSTHVAAFDVVDVHAVFSHSSLAAAQACRRADVPYVVRPHGALDPWSLGRKRWQKRLFMAVGARAMLQGARAIQYTTGTERRLAEQQLPWLPSGTIVPLAVEDRRFDVRCTHEEPPSVLTMSRLDPKKGLELLIDAFHAGTGHGPLSTWRLVIAGDGDPRYVERLRDRAGRGPAAGRVRFTGWVSGVEQDRLIAASTLVASPSAQENFGLSLMEAMAAGLPALVTPGVNLASELEAAGAGWVVLAEPGALAAALRGILGDRAELRRRGAAARELASGYRWANSTAHLVALYETVRRRGVA